MYQFINSVTEDDYLAFNEYHLLHSTQGKRVLMTHRLLTPSISLFAIVVFWIADVSRELLITEMIGLGLLSIVMTISSKKRILKTVKRNIARFKRDGKLPFSKDTIITFDEDHVHEKSNETETRIQYSMIDKVVEGNQVIYIYFSALQAFILPHRSFESDEQKNEFLSFLNTKCQKA